MKMKLKMTSKVNVSKSLEIELGGVKEKISESSIKEDIKKAEEEATEALLRKFFENCCSSKKMGNILVDVLSRPIK